MLYVNFYYFCSILRLLLGVYTQGMLLIAIGVLWRFFLSWNYRISGMIPRLPVCLVIFIEHARLSQDIL